MPDASTVTLPGLEIVKVGKWAASTGAVEVTAADIADAVAASKDPEVDKGPLKFGHTGALSDLGDSTPAFGWLDNLSIAPDGETVIGDLVDVPAALADAIKAAFKRRSAELAWGVETVGGKTYRMVIDGLALLGVQAPAVKGMADLAALYDPAAPPVALATSKLSAESHSTLSLYDAMPADTAGERIADRAQCAKDAVAQLAAMAGTAALQPALDAIDAMVPADSRGLLAAAPHHDPVSTPSASGGSMATPTLSAEQIADARTKLGLPAESTDEQVTAKLSELADLVDASKTPGPEPKADEPKVDEPKVLEPAALSAETLAQLKDAGLTVVPTGVLEQVQAGAAAGAEARTLLAAQARDAVLDEALAAGKLGAGDTAVKVRAQLSAQLDKDPEGTKALIDALPAIVPVGEIGSMANAGEHTALAAADAALDAEIAALFAGEIATPAKEA